MKEIEVSTLKSNRLQKSEDLTKVLEELLINKNLNFSI